MAAQSLVRASYADPIGTYATNVMGNAARTRVDPADAVDSRRADCDV